ncbi:hypothetical protein [Oceanobacillus salinisoli]|uniref:hypothetical protein n=1 Tax=Oceanobacillus salinisoli TaxID=2678611 RepID=UPI0012E23C32|nr:hypothetical protein [Oceanobacillus salinisoli]
MLMHSIITNFIFAIVYLLYWKQISMSIPFQLQHLLKIEIGRKGIVQEKGRRSFLYGKNVYAVGNGNVIEGRWQPTNATARGSPNRLLVSSRA